MKEIRRLQRTRQSPPDLSGPVVAPPRITAAQEEWREPPPLEFFVDFETVSDLNDDFRTFPKAAGQAMIFMIGCGHVEERRWKFRCFIADRLDAGSEARIVEDWLAHTKELGRSVGVNRPRIYHWGHAERTLYRSARKRHRDRSWPDPNWFDLHARVFRKEPVTVRGAAGKGLKSVARALHAEGRIASSWSNSKVDGLGAMVGAWWCAAEARRRGILLKELELMKEIRDYNEVDCRVMQETLQYLRTRH